MATEQLFAGGEGGVTEHGSSSVLRLPLATTAEVSRICSEASYS